MSQDEIVAGAILLMIFLPLIVYVLSPDPPEWLDSDGYDNFDDEDGE